MYLKVTDMLGSKMTVKKTWAAVGTHIQISWEHGKLKIQEGEWLCLQTRGEGIDRRYSISHPNSHIPARAYKTTDRRKPEILWATGPSDFS